jgi:alcohol dehydrogenase YqhD (iron-dependent ADH family)
MNKKKLQKIEKRLDEIWQYRDSLLVKKHLKKIQLTNEEELILKEYNDLMNLVEKEKLSDTKKKNIEELSKLLEKCKNL